MSTASKSVVGRLAPCPYRPGDDLPAVGTSALVSGVNQDVGSDQNRSYSWRRVIGYSPDMKFVCLQTDDCWPTVERLENCWFAEIPIKMADIKARFVDGIRKDAADVIAADLECDAAEAALSRAARCGSKERIRRLHRVHDAATKRDAALRPFRRK